jgi:hypothetical protein
MSAWRVLRQHVQLRGLRLNGSMLAAAPSTACAGCGRSSGELEILVAEQISVPLVNVVADHLQREILFLTAITSASSRQCVPAVSRIRSNFAL